MAEGGDDAGADRATPGSRHMATYRKPAGDGLDGRQDGRLTAPTFARNSPPIIARLAPWLTGLCGPVLEIGSGTGQHAAAMALAFPNLQWWPSDPDAAHRVSISAWQTHLRAPGRAAMALDGAADWASDAGVAALGPLAGVVSMNVIHISPVAVARGIIAGAGKALGPGGMLIFYGPFKENGEHTGAGNAAFDRGLRAENPDWGLRDIAELTAWSAAAGLGREAVITMPANNRILLFRKP